jgi:UDP-glucuronate decarboxylase
LGSHLCERLIAQGDDVLCVDNYFTGRKDNLAPLLGDPHFEALRHDITHPLFVEVDEIYNLACPASPIHYQFDPVQTTKTSVIGAINMLGLAKRLKAKIFQASTSEVYGDPGVHPQPESYRGNVNPIGPRACYDEGKRCAEPCSSTISASTICGSSTPTGRACTPMTAVWSPTSSSRRSRRNRSPSMATAARPAPSAMSTI